MKFPKPPTLIERLLQISSEEYHVILDYFAGSGTTGHAVIDLNRKDGGHRKYILVEMGDHFDTVLKPRLEKVVYSPDWADGKPETSGKGISHCFKYLTLESYEDALNNIQRKNEIDHLPGVVREEFLLKYMLELESRDSIINTDAFIKPFDYQLDIAVDSAGATALRKVDLVETFNYLLGLTVHGIDRRIDKGYVMVTGVLPGETKESLIIWRDCGKIGNKELNELLEKQCINPENTEFSTIFVNGDHGIRNHKIGDSEENPGLKIRQIENVFLSKMFEVK